MFDIILPTPVALPNPFDMPNAEGVSVTSAVRLRKFAVALLVIAENAGYVIDDCIDAPPPINFTIGQGAYMCHSNGDP